MRAPAYHTAGSRWGAFESGGEKARLEDLVDIHYFDHRDIEGRYDKIVSIEMLEAVGREYWDEFFATLERLLSPHGLVLLQVIYVPDQRFASYRRGADWVRKHASPRTGTATCSSC